MTVDNKREIKFRALVEYKGLGEVWEYYTTFAQPIWLEPNVAKIIVKDLQFCGLKDKNGKEIYEGDIVKHLARNKKWEPLNDDSPMQVEISSVVEYKDHGFWLSNESFGWEGEDLADWNNLEVIGNITKIPI